MRKFLRYAVPVPLVLCVAAASFGAEAIKLRLMTAVYSDEKGGALKRPEGVACDEKSLLVVADTGNGRILLYTVSGEKVMPKGTVSVPQLSYPIRVQIDPGGEILALDGKSRRIARVTPAGEFKGYVDPSGIPTPGTVIPRSFKVDGKGNIHLLDIFSGRVLVLDSSGKYQREVPFPQKYGGFSDLAVDGNGTVYLLDSVEGKVFSAQRNATAFTPLSGSLKEDLDFPVSIASDSRGRLFLSDQNGSGIVILGPDGSFRGRQSDFGWKDGLLRYPSALAVTEGGNLFIADRQNSRVQVFTIVQ